MQKMRLEVDHKLVREFLQLSTHAHTYSKSDGQHENIMPVAESMGCMDA